MYDTLSTFSTWTVVFIGPEFQKSAIWGQREKEKPNICKHPTIYDFFLAKQQTTDNNQAAPKLFTNSSIRTIPSLWIDLALTAISTKH